MTSPTRSPRGRLLVLFGDQLDIRSPVLDDLDRKRDTVLMMEVLEESTHVPSHVQRTVLFLSAMRHFARELDRRGYRVEYVRLDDADNTHGFEGEIRRSVERRRPETLEFIRPGEWRVLRMCDRLRRELPLTEVRMHEDSHFYLAPDEFATWAEGRKEFVLEHFYRMMRRRLRVLVDEHGRPEGGQWNFDKHNRRPFQGERAEIDRPRQFVPDDVTREVIETVRSMRPDAPGRIEEFPWPVTRREALAGLRHFIRHRLPDFGTYQDAMVSDKPWMFHSLLSAPLNLKLLNPREIVSSALDAYRSGTAPLNAVEGFVRQIIGWREFVRGVYWHEGPAYRDRNNLLSRGSIPAFYWTGETDMACLRQCLSQVLAHGYGHHIQRLMVTGNFALLSGVHPRKVSDWYLGMYVDAVDWVTLPNTLGMVMHADGGVVGTKPYAAGGNYISRMSDYCERCRFDPKKRTGEDACPFTTLYWHFLDRNEGRLRDNPRMGIALKNLDRLGEDERKAIRQRGTAIRRSLGVLARK